MNEQRASEIIDDLQQHVFFSSLPNEKLFEALCERLEAHFDLEGDPEISTILDIIAGRLSGDEIKCTSVKAHFSFDESHLLHRCEKNDGHEGGHKCKCGQEFEV